MADKKQQIEKSRNQFIMGQKANLLKPYITNLKDTAVKIANNKSILENLEKELPKVEKTLKEIEEKYDKALKHKEEQIPNLKIKIENCKQAENMKKENEKLIKETTALETIYITNIESRKQKNRQIDELKSKN